MRSIFRPLWWGFLISFLGSLPLGTLNIAAMQIAIQESIVHALWFAFGSLLVEMIYVRASIGAIDWIRKQGRLMVVMEWLTLLIILALAFGSFWSAWKGGAEAKSVFLQQNLHRFFLGMLMSAVNPVQIPFWFGWSNVLFSKGVLRSEPKLYNTYIIGIGLGTLLGNSVFIFGGKWAVDSIQNSQTYLNWIIGTVFLITAFIQAIKMIRHKDSVSKFLNKKATDCESGSAKE
jgi:threonine/homoserine/homoserine lactone efflux protein